MSLSPADTVDVLLRIRTEGREQLDSLEKAARGVTAAGKEEQTVFQALQATMKEFSASVSGVTGALNVNSQALQAHQANSRNVVSSNGRTASSMTEARPRRSSRPVGPRRRGRNRGRVGRARCARPRTASSTRPLAARSSNYRTRRPCIGERRDRSGSATDLR